MKQNSMNDPLKLWISASMKQWINEWDDKRINQPINQSIHPSINQSINETTNQPTHQSEWIKARLKNWKLKSTQSARARPPSKSESWTCQSDAFLQDFPQKVKVEDVKTKPSCETSVKNCRLTMWKLSLRARLPSKFGGRVVQNDVWSGSYTAVAIREWSENDRSTPGTVSHPSGGRPSPSISRGAFFPAKHSTSRIRQLSKRHFVRDVPAN